MVLMYASLIHQCHIKTILLAAVNEKRISSPTDTASAEAISTGGSNSVAVSLGIIGGILGVGVVILGGVAFRRKSLDSSSDNSLFKSGGGSGGGDHSFENLSSSSENTSVPLSIQNTPSNDTAAVIAPIADAGAGMAMAPVAAQQPVAPAGGYVYYQQPAAYYPQPQVAYAYPTAPAPAASYAPPPTQYQAYGYQ
ncbi:hypothetical protein HK102_000794 [Quaeritorhiza haematococci]|nr:hypothetical protein HK102_000794 [Quaeritorhiza haematococci]